MAGWRGHLQGAVRACSVYEAGRAGAPWGPATLGLLEDTADHAPVPAHAGRSRETASGTSTRSPAAPGPSSVPSRPLGLGTQPPSAFPMASPGLRQVSRFHVELSASPSH